MAKRLVFGDLGPKFMLFRVFSPEGEEYELRIKTMTEADVNAVNVGIDDPQPPMIDKFVSKEKGYVKEKNWEDPDYVKKNREAGRQRMYRLLASAVDLEIPGEGIEAKSQALQEGGVPAWLLAKCVDIINRSLGLNTEEVQRRVETFQPS